MKLFQLQRVSGFAKVAILIAVVICLLGLIYATVNFIYTMVKADDLSKV